MEVELLHKKKSLAPKLRFKDYNKGWEKKKLDEVVKIGRGKSKHRPRNASFLYGGIYPFVQTGDIKAADLYLTKYTQTYSEEGLKQSKLWDENTLCVTIAANIAETAILKIKACFPDSIIGLIPKENQTTVLFVKYLFDKFKIEIKNLSQGIAQDNLNQEKLSNIEFVFPTLPEQQKIASFLSAVDEKIQVLTRKKELLEQYKKGVMQQLFSGKLRFKDENGKAFAKWEEKRLSEVVNVIDPHPSHRAPNAVQNGIPFIGIGDISTKGEVDFTSVRIVGDEIYTEHRDRYKIELGDFAYGRVASIGKVVELDLSINERYSFSPTMAIIKPQLVDSIYIRFYMQSDDFIQIVESKTTGSTRKSLGVQNLRLIPIKMPTDKEQKKIANYLSNIDKKIESVNKQITQTQTFKKGLLQQMFV